ncbi:MAG: hypothetical protein JOZ77_05140 [Candidatus Eremiobacteraeota bacterium]|nr:hypothetical protein [Candidatus Eremiobacteraeota bacterium]
MNARSANWIVLFPGKHYVLIVLGSLLFAACGAPGSNTQTSASLMPQDAAHSVSSGFTGPIPAASSKFNVVNQFSIASNPNGVWSYIYSGGLMTVKSKDCEGITKLDCWNNGEGAPDDSSITRNETGQTQQISNGAGGSITFPTNYLVLDGEDDPVGADVRFTSPMAGTYMVSGNFEGLDTGEQSHPVEVQKNGATFFSETVSGFEVPVHFKLKFGLNKGDQIDFISEGFGNGEFLETGLQAKLVTK